MNTNITKVNILQNIFKGHVSSLFMSIFFIFSLFLSVSFNHSLAQSNTEKYSWSNKNFLKEINKERTKRKLNTLKENKELNRLAKIRLDDMIKNNYFAHESPTGNGIDELLTTSSYDYEWRGENLAYGDYINEKDVTVSWMASKWHRYNILYKNFEEVGTAYAVADFKDGKHLIVVQVFGKEIKNNNNLAKK